jgi:hypothetical protein
MWSDDFSFKSSCNLTIAWTYPLFTAKLLKACARALRL